LTFQDSEILINILNHGAAMKNIFLGFTISLFLSTSFTPHAEAVFSDNLSKYSWTPTLLNSYGEIALMNEYEANRACKELGARLPTPYEWAYLMTQIGTGEILTSAEYKGEQGFQSVEYWNYKVADNVNGQWEHEHFYFFPAPYISPVYKLDKVVFWTRGQMKPPTSPITEEDFVVFDARDGYLRPNMHVGNIHAARCVLNSF
jgi:hypothetical protein